MKHGIFLRLSSYGLRIGLLLLAITTVGAIVFGSPAALKSALQDSGAYIAASDRLARQAGSAAGSQPELGASQAVVEVAAQQSFTPQVIQANTEKAADNIYAWLEGKSESPEIKLDLSPFVNQLLQSVSEQATQRAQSLPACTAEQLREIDPNKLDIYSLPCRPPGINLDVIKQQATNQVVSSNDFLQNPIIGTDSLPKDEQGKTVLDRAESLPQAYQWTMRGPWIFGGLTLLCAALVMWLLWDSGWREGVRKLARSLIGVGITLLVMVAVAKLFFHFVTAQDGLAGDLAGGDFQEVTVTFIKSLEQVYSSKLLIFGIIYTAAAVIVFLVLRFWRPASTPVTTPIATTTPQVPKKSLS